MDRRDVVEVRKEGRIVNHEIDYFGETYSTRTPTALKFLHPEGHFAIQSHEAGKSADYRCDYLGVYDDHTKAANDAVQMDNRYAPKATWTTLNPVLPEAAGLSNGKMSTLRKNKGIDDKWIASRSNILFDVDANTRVSGNSIKGINSTDDELKQVIDDRQKLEEGIYRESGIRGMVTISGNGAALIFPIETMPCDTDTDRIIEGSILFWNSKIPAVDTSIVDRARKTKLPGTWARKADETVGRPHRRSAFRLPDQRQVLPRDVLEDWANRFSSTKVSISVPAVPKPKQADEPVLSDWPWEKWGRELPRQLDALDANWPRVGNEGENWGAVVAAAKAVADQYDKHDVVYAMVEQWSRASSRYLGPEEFKKQYDGYQVGRPGDIGQGTLLHLARKHGWTEEGRPKISNFKRVDGKVAVLPLQKVVNQAMRIGIDFYNRVEDLVAYDGDNRYDVKNPSHLVAILSEKADVEWLQNGASKSELFEGIKLRAKKIRAVETVPHFPPLHDVLYTHAPITPSTSTSEIDKVVSLCNPESDVDASLIRAATITTHWGGPPGTRPMTLITCLTGIGSGKTSTATLIGSTGPNGEGTYTVRRLRDENDVGQVVKHLVTPSRHTIRTIILDNAKGVIGGEAVESLNTARTLNGHLMYGGLGAVPNYYSVIVASNSTDVTPDIASRSVQIFIRPADYGPDYESQIANIDRERLWAEIAGFFQRPVARLSEYTRFPVWCNEILGRMPNGNELVQLIKERSKALADNTEVAIEIRDRITLMLGQRGYDPTSSVVLMPSSSLAGILDGVDGVKQYTSRTVNTLLRGHLSNPKLIELEDNKNTSARGFIWRGVATDSTTPKVSMDTVIASEATEGPFD